MAPHPALAHGKVCYVGDPIAVAIIVARVHLSRSKRGLAQGVGDIKADALFVAGDGFFTSRRGQFVTLTAVNKLPATYANRDIVAAGGLMSYGTDLADLFHQAGVYTGKILKGAKPADLPVQQSTKFEFVINLQTARALSIEVPSGLLSIVDEVIE